MLTKSRRQLSKSSKDARGLSDWMVENDGGMCRDYGGGLADMLLHRVWWFEPQNHRWMVFGFRPQNPIGVSARMGGSTWRHHEACVETKQSREEPMAIECTNLELDHFAHRVKWFSLNI
jgi:hypothetical protein